MILNIEPVAHLVAFTVNGQGFAIQRLGNDQRDEFFRKVVRAVIVGTVCNKHWKTERMAPSGDEMIGTGL